MAAPQTERKIDLSTWKGPMTVVGYPDLSWKPAEVRVDTHPTTATASQASIPDKPSKPHGSR